MKTVFVLGAGSSYDFGFPLGAELIERIATFLGKVRDPLTVSQGSFNEQEKLVETILGGQSQHSLGNPKFNIARKIASRIAFFPSIDAFIEASHNEEERKLAKSMIVKFISAAEGDASLLGAAHLNNGTWKSRQPQFPKLQSHWLMVFFGQLAGTCRFDQFTEKLKNYAVVQFNYDRVFEHFMLQAIMRRFEVGQIDAAICLNQLDIIRPYGSIGRIPLHPDEQVEQPLLFGQAVPDGNLAFRGAFINTMSDKEPDKYITHISKALNGANKLVFLGFGFGQLNMRFFRPTRGWRNVYATGKGFSDYTRAKIGTSLSRLCAQSGKIKGFDDCTCAELLKEYGDEFFL